MKQIPSRETICLSAGQQIVLFVQHLTLKIQTFCKLRRIDWKMGNDVSNGRSDFMLTVTQDTLIVLFHPEHEGITMIGNVAYIYHSTRRTVPKELSALKLLFNEAVNCIASVTNE
jgi:hypothetical protein